MTFLAQGIEFNLTSSMYILGNKLQTKCDLTIRPNSLEGQIILGANFLRNHFIVFNKDDNTIGFQKLNAKVFHSYLHNEMLLRIIIILQSFVILFFTCVMCFPSKETPVLRQAINDTV